MKSPPASKGGVQSPSQWEYFSIMGTCQGLTLPTVSLVLSTNYLHVLPKSVQCPKSIEYPVPQFTGVSVSDARWGLVSLCSHRDVQSLIMMDPTLGLSQDQCPELELTCDPTYNTESPHVMTRIRIIVLTLSMI